MITAQELSAYPIVYKGEFAEVYDMSAEIPGVAFAFWRGFFSLENPTFIKEMNDSVDEIKKRGIKVFISDHSYLKLVKDDVLQWLHDNWYTGAYQNGLVAELSIDAKSIFGKLSLEKMLNEAKMGGVVSVKVHDLEDGKKAAKQFCEKAAV
ncbi:hypothetical protein FUAX_05790 [Fulvitalea axinellae]|uniref:Uncharacterized protein n=1 Tax=Fulvitalea axinellae TaxID=1182444 RepID=A0AAU9CMS2_9BACT|nr:hypothetical protein FUAX_05790 [Fulvitalea axinellae]